MIKARPTIFGFLACKKIGLSFQQIELGNEVELNCLSFAESLVGHTSC